MSRNCQFCSANPCVVVSGRRQQCRFHCRIRRLREKNAALSGVAVDASALSLKDYLDDSEIAGSVLDVQTPLGPFDLEACDCITPSTVQSFPALPAAGNYDGILFYRFVPGLVIQDGDTTILRERPASATSPAIQRLLMSSTAGSNLSWVGCRWETASICAEPRLWERQVEIPTSRRCSGLSVWTTTQPFWILRTGLYGFRMFPSRRRQACPRAPFSPGCA